MGRKKLEMDPIAVRRACREYAQKYVDLQRSQFERIGVFGRWNDPYLTMSFGYEASIVETFYDFFEKEFVYKGLKPVYWCIHDKTALAEAEVEYEQHTSPSVYVRYALTSDPAAIDAALAGKQRLHHHLDHDPVDPPRLAGCRLQPRPRVRRPALPTAKHLSRRRDCFLGHRECHR